MQQAYVSAALQLFQDWFESAHQRICEQRELTSPARCRLPARGRLKQRDGGRIRYGFRTHLRSDKFDMTNVDCSMFKPKPVSVEGKSELYESLCAQLRGLLSGESDPIANAANMAALLFELLPDLNWAGFYFLRNGELVLGPFQGRPACVRIAVGKGVCGTAVQRRQSIVVDDVHAFP